MGNFQNIDLSIISCEAVGLINMLSIFGYLYRHRKTLSKSSKYFLISITFLCLGIIFDLISYLFEGILSLNWLLTISNYLAIVLADAIDVVFILYIYSVACINDKNASKSGFILTAILCAIDFIFETYGYITHKTVYLENAIFQANDLYIVFYIVQVVAMLIGIFYIILNKKALKLHYSISFCIYYLIPLAAFVVAYFFPKCMYVYSSIPLSFLIVYVEIESRKERILFHKIIYDVLTGLLNRRAYIDRLEEIKNSKDIRNVGIIFCDINGLKIVNDTQGHSAGDKLIVDFSKILTSNFRETGIFRISGDEFVVILNSISKKEFENRLMSFEQIMNDNKNIASIGGAYGSVEEVEKLVDEAEKNMYASKDEYYIKNNIPRRNDKQG